MLDSDLRLSFPLTVDPRTGEFSDRELRLQHLAAQEEARLLEIAARVPLKVRWRKSWTPEKIAHMVYLYALDSGIPPSGDPDTAAVNFLRHERTAYDRIVHPVTGLQCGRHGEHARVYLTVKRRVLDRVAEDFPWLADEAARQFEVSAARAGFPEMADAAPACRV